MRYRGILLFSLWSMGCGNKVELDPVNWAELGAIRALHGIESEPRLYVAGDDGALLRFDGDEFGRIEIEALTDFTGLAVDGEEILAVGCSEDGMRGELYTRNAHPDTEEWSQGALSGAGNIPCIRAITRAGGGYFAVGDGGLVLSSRTGDDWQRASSPTQANLYGVSASSNLQAFAVGERGTMLRINGDEWTELPKVVGTDLFAVHVASSNSAIAVGAHGEILSFDGNVWTRLRPDTQNTLYAVASATVQLHANAPVRPRIIVAGAGGLVLAQGDDQNWVPVAAMTDRDLFTIWGPRSVAEAIAFAAGSEATILELVFHDVR